MTIQIRPDMSLDEAKKYLRELWKKGTTCPCCSQRVQLYRRTINVGQAVSLIKMYRARKCGWQHVPTTIGRQSAEEGKLRYWGLVEEYPEPREDGGRAGWWRVTEKGASFVLNEIKVPKHAWVFNQKCYGLDADKGHISIVDALGSKFSYRDLLDGTA